jgi:predicted DNA-binding protein (MmcQ/YjbR family)
MASSAQRLLTRLRRLARALPGTSETITFGHPTFQAAKKTFAVLEPYQGEEVLSFKASPEDQALLILDPRFFVAPYVGQHGWTSLRIASGVEEGELEELVRSSYRRVATKRMLAELEGKPRQTKKK